MYFKFSFVSTIGKPCSKKLTGKQIQNYIFYNHQNQYFQYTNFVYQQIIKIQISKIILLVSYISHNFLIFQHMEEKNIYHLLMRAIFGKKYILMMTDTAEIMARQQQLQQNPIYQQTYKKISSSLINHIVSGGALAFALSLSMQRYFPQKFSTFGVNKILVDLTLIAICLFTATNMAAKTNNNEIMKIKKDLMLKYDKGFLRHMTQIEIKYEIEEQDQVRGVLTNQQYKEWVYKRHQHIY